MTLFGKLLASGLLGLTLATSSVDASPPDPGGTSTPDRFLKPGSLWNLGAGILKAVLEFRSETPSLTPQQRASIRAVLEAYRVDIGNQLRARVAAERALREAIRTNPALIDTAAQRLGETAREGAKLQARLALSLRPYLSAEQQQQFAALQNSISKSVDDFIASNF